MKLLKRNPDAVASKRARRDASKAQKSAAETAKKANLRPPGLLERVTDPRTARRAIAVAKLAGPLVAPVALKLSTGIRGAMDRRRAAKLGVAADEVSMYRGPTGPVVARITTLQGAIDDLRRRKGADSAVTRFADSARSRLTDLRAAARAAASMPSSRRRATLSTITSDLDQIDSDLMTFLVGNAA